MVNHTGLVPDVWCSTKCFLTRLKAIIGDTLSGF